MYRIAKIEDLPKSDFKPNDTVLMSDLNTIREESANKEFRTTKYMSSAIDVVNAAFTTLRQFERMLDSTYLTTELTDTYITANTLIHDQHVTNVLKIGAEGGFLTRTEAGNMKAECLKLIVQLKEKAMNTFTANLDAVFKRQQSQFAVPFGGMNKGGSLGETLIDNNAERFSSTADASNYDFFDGPFSLKHLLTTFDMLKADADFWTTNTDENGILNLSFDSIETVKKEIAALKDKPDKSYGFCNAAEDGTITVPDVAYDDNVFGKTQPVATAVFETLKRQIYVVIKNVYTQYLVKMTQFPEPGANSTTIGDDFGDYSQIEDADDDEEEEEEQQTND